ncbi:MAG: hypothetical protein ACREPF_12325 [Rhodanobacteraceae bacterium]
MRKSFFAVGCACVLAGSVASVPAHAGHAHYSAGVHVFARHNYGHFSAHDQAMWRGGTWHHAYFRGRWGWWWPAGGAWYFYPQPIYPYPLAVSPVLYPAPPPVVVAPAAAPPPPVVLAPPPKFRYYCNDPAGYYPQVVNCATAFQKIPVH